MMVHRRRRRKDDDERGVAMVELAIVLPIFILMIFGMVEFGLMFRERMTIASAASSAARTGATLGTEEEADYRILQALEAGLYDQVDASVLISVDIFRATPSGTKVLGDINRYIYDASLGGCKWIPCPDPTSVPIPYGSPDGWWPVDRDTTLTGGIDVLGVEVVYQHDTVTNIIPFLNRQLTERALVRLEPDVLGGTGP